jgi:hypothetical protein
VCWPLHSELGLHAYDPTDLPLFLAMLQLSVVWFARLVVVFDFVFVVVISELLVAANRVSLLLRSLALFCSNKPLDVVVPLF